MLNAARILVAVEAHEQEMRECGNDGVVERLVHSQLWFMPEGNVMVMLHESILGL